MLGPAHGTLMQKYTSVFGMFSNSIVLIAGSLLLNRWASAGTLRLGTMFLAIKCPLSDLSPTTSFEGMTICAHNSNWGIFQGS